MKRQNMATGGGRPLSRAERGLRALREAAPTHGRRLLGWAFMFVLLYLLLRLARIVMAWPWEPSGRGDDAESRPTTVYRRRPGPAGRAQTPTRNSARTRQQPRPARKQPQPVRQRPTRQRPAQTKKSRWRRAERWLVLLEVAAVLFVLVSAAGAWVTLQDLNDTYRVLHKADPEILPTIGAAANPALADIQRPLTEPPQLLPDVGAIEAPALPTPPPTATPVSPTAEPESVIVAPALPTVAPTPMPDYAQRIQIPAIGVDSQVFQSSDPRALKLGVAQFGYMTELGQPGNLVLAAHNDTYGEIFRYLEDLEQGDEITLFGDYTSHKYRVRSRLIVEPDEVWVTLPTPSSTLTLITCHPYLIDTHRLVVFADLVE